MIVLFPAEVIFVFVAVVFNVFPVPDTVDFIVTFFSAVEAFNSTFDESVVTPVRVMSPVVAVISLPREIVPAPFCSNSVHEIGSAAARERTPELSIVIFPVEVNFDAKVIAAPVYVIAVPETSS